MGTLLLGLVVGLAVGVVLGRRSLGATPVADAPAPGPVTPVVAPADRSAPEQPAPALPVAPNKRGRKVGLTDADFTPADDILHRMHEAWQRGTTLEDLGEPPHPATPDEPVVAPLPDDDERVRRVLERAAAARGEQEPMATGTVTEAIAELETEGYGDDLRLDPEASTVACRSCGTTHGTAGIEVDRVLRFEGPSDPADEAIVLGLRCPECGAKGALVSAFGPGADPSLAEAFVYLASRARHR